MDEKYNMWRIRGVDMETRKRIKQYALDNDMTVGRALSLLTSPAGNDGKPDYGCITSKDFVVSGDLRAAYNELKKRYKR